MGDLKVASPHRQVIVKRQWAGRRGAGERSRRKPGQLLGGAAQGNGGRERVGNPLWGARKRRRMVAWPDLMNKACMPRPQVRLVKRVDKDTVLGRCKLLRLRIRFAPLRSLDDDSRAVAPENMEAMSGEGQRREHQCTAGKLSANQIAHRSERARERGREVMQGLCLSLSWMKCGVDSGRTTVTCISGWGGERGLRATASAGMKCN